MKCNKCKEDNRPKAKYCKACGKPFTDRDREVAYKSTIYYRLDSLVDKYKCSSLKKVTDTRSFKVTSLVLIALIIIYFAFIW